MQQQPVSLTHGKVLEDLGQTVDLTRRIREVLANYPQGTTFLKELIRNADDAGTTAVSLCLDRRGSLAFNDAVFIEEDFVTVSKIGGSSKHGQASKTGRFGCRGYNCL